MQGDRDTCTITERSKAKDRAVAVPVPDVLDGARGHVQRQQVREDPAHGAQPQAAGQLLQQAVARVGRERHAVARRQLRRLHDGGHARADAQRHVGVALVAPEQEAHALVARGAPVGQEALHDGGVLEQHVVHVAVGLPVQRHRARLALRADASRPRRVLRTSCRRRI